MGTPETLGSSSLFNSDNLSLIMASPTPFRVRKPKIAAKRPIKRSENDIESLGPSIPQKRKRLDIESSPIEFRASPSISSFSFGSIGATTPGSASTGGIDLKRIVQEAISPLINEIRELRSEVQQLKAKPAEATATTTAATTLKVVEKQREALNRAKPPKKALQTSISKEVENKEQSATILAKKPSYASALAKDIALSPASQAPWTLI